MPRAVVCGAVAMRPGQGGHAWVFLQWLAGLQRLGFEVAFVDRMARPSEANHRWLDRVMAVGGVSDVALLDDGPQGHPRSTVADETRQWFADAEVCIDIMGHGPEELVRLARRALFVDIDPGFGQYWQHLGLASMFGRHDAYLSVGLAMGAGGCTVPSLGIDWLPTLPPVDLEAWPAQTGPGRCVTTVASWRGPFDPIEVDGDRLGLRVHQFRQYLGVPRRAGVTVELALQIDPADERDAVALRDHGFDLVDPLRVAGDPVSFRTYVQGSSAELCVAKDLYVRTGAGWFSDRSACYLASGRPVAHHDTGFAGSLPHGMGLLCFSDEASAAGALSRIEADPSGHAEAARAIARDHLDAGVVVARALERAGVA